MESTTLVKAFHVIETLAGQQPPMSLAQVASGAAITKPTAHRILKTLGELGYVDRADGGSYRLGHRMLRIVLGQEHQRLAEIARPILAKLHAQTRETLNLAILRQDKVVYLLILESPLPLRHVTAANETHPYYSTALGRAMVAHLTGAHQQRLIQATRFTRRTARTTTDAASLRRILARTRQNGYAMEQDETDVGVTCIGAPIIDGDRAVAAISISVPTARADARVRPGLVGLIRTAAAKISAAVESSKLELP